MGAYDVRFWLLPQDRSIESTETTATTADGTPVRLLSFPPTDASAAGTDSCGVREWLARHLDQDDGGHDVFVHDELRIDLYEDAASVDSLRVTMPIYNLATRRVASRQRIVGWVALVTRLVGDLSLRVFNGDMELPAEAIADEVNHRIAEMGLKTLPS